MKWTVETIQNIIKEKIPEGSVFPQHTEKGHFYGVKSTAFSTPEDAPFPSVTGKLQILKDESIINFKMNQAIGYVFKHWPEFTEANVMQHLDMAEKQSADIFEDAGDIGTKIHDARHAYFMEWMKTGARPAEAINFISADVLQDVRAISAMRALEKFVIENDYRPAASELMLYNEKLAVGGTLDDLGIMRRVIVFGKDQFKNEHEHELLENDITNVVYCLRCEYKFRNDFVLMDIKTSNQFKDHYFFQVALYYWMFFKLARIRPERCFILKLSKRDGTYKIEDLKRPGMLASYARSMIRTDQGLDYVRSLRKDNQRVVGEIINV